MKLLWERRARSSKTRYRIEVDDAGKYHVTCEHGTTRMMDTTASAIEIAKTPAEWCDKCATACGSDADDAALTPCRVIKHDDGSREICSVDGVMIIDGIHSFTTLADEVRERRLRIVTE